MCGCLEKRKEIEEGRNSLAYLSREFDDPRGRNDEVTMWTKSTHFRQSVHTKTTLFVVVRRFAPGTGESHYFLIAKRKFRLE